jgi:hypothetical protein
MKDLRGRPLFASVALLVSGLALVGCNDEWAPHPQVELPLVQCPSAAQALDIDGGMRHCFEIIADFDTGTFNYGSDRSGGWFSYDDHSLPTDLAIHYTAGAAFDPTHQTFAPMAASSKALHASSDAYSGAFGSGLGTNMNSVADPPTPDGMAHYHALPYDASRFDGIVLWAKRGSTSGVSSTVRVQITTVATDSDYAAHFGAGLAANGATMRDPRICDPNTPSTARCDDDYGKALTLLSDWGEPYKIPWSDLDQEGFGRVPPEGFQPSEIVTLKFTNKQGQAFDEWFDDIAFYKE